MPLGDLLRFYAALHQQPDVRAQLERQGPTMTDAQVADCARAGGFDVTATDLAEYRRIRPYILRAKPLHDRVDKDPLLRAELTKLAGGPVNSVAPAAVVAAYSTLAKRLGLPFDAEAIRMGVDVERGLAHAASRPLQESDLSTNAFCTPLRRAAPALRGNIVQAYPSVEYGYPPNR